LFESMLSCLANRNHFLRDVNSQIWLYCRTFASRLFLKYSPHPTNLNDSKSPVRILTIILSPLRIHVWSYHQKLDSLQSKIIFLSKVVRPETHALSAWLQSLALPRHLVAYWICRALHFRRVWSNFFQKQASQKSRPVYSGL
jgi:hypothetical protein